MNKQQLLVSLLAGVCAVAALLALLGGGQSVVNAVQRASVSATPAGEWHVCEEGPPDCDYATIQEAVDVAGEGDLVKVAAGIYAEVHLHARSDVTTTGLVTQVVYISRTLTLQGGFTTTNWVTSEPEFNPTTLDAQGQGRVLYITGDVTPTVQGLRITGGNSDGLGGSPYGGDEGGGIYAISATVTLSRNVIYSNAATDNGGGAFLLHTDGATLSGNDFHNNTAGNEGGGVCLLLNEGNTLTDNAVYSNTAGQRGGGVNVNGCVATKLSGNQVYSNTAVYDDGGGVWIAGTSNAELDGNTIYNNWASDIAGGVYLQEDDSPRLSDNTVFQNTATDSAGGVYMVYCDNTILEHNNIYSNTADRWGGGVLVASSDNVTLSGNHIHGNASNNWGGGVNLWRSGHATLDNNVIADNQAGVQGSGVFAEDDVTAHLRHNTIARNTGGDGSGVHVTPFEGTPAVVTMTNNILVSHTVGITVATGCTATLQSTLWGSGAWANDADWLGASTSVTSTHDIWGDPVFVDPDAGDYHLGLASAAIEAGIGAGVTDDIDGHLRPMGSAPDIGADEVWKSSFLSPTVNVNLATEPPTLDPATATDTTSHNVIDQLFAALVSLDEETGSISPELATTWTVSSDAMVYTFTLRADTEWSDGQPITAGDIHYGILRSLDPSMADNPASMLYIIENAEGYHEGTITDTSQVGVTVVDTTTLRVDLAHSASYALAILAQPVARPTPQWAIDAHGDAWTEPENIVVSGPYRLAEWAHDHHILLEKNSTYFDADEVQIAWARLWMVDAATAWEMYLDGQLDTVAVPTDNIDGAEADPVLSQELVHAPRACTEYYGFTTSQTPFDQPLVRKAFIAATDRQRLITDVLAGGPEPALTYTPPGVFGHVDGYAEGVGIPYDPTQAQQWLGDAGYPNGEGLPPITLWFNTWEGHQANAEYVRDSWYATLGVSVTLDSMAWDDYISEPLSRFQVWRLGWCMDYADANNFLDDGVYRDNFDWNNGTYEALLDQAASEEDPDARAALYQQAEEILVESDAVMLPLYYFATSYATRPYLQRTYPTGGGFGDIAVWQITGLQDTVGAQGALLSFSSGDTVVDVPSGAFAGTVLIEHEPVSGMPPGADQNLVGQAFELSAVYTDTGELAQPVEPCTFTLNYSDTQVGRTVEDTLALYHWDEGTGAWSQDGISSTVDTDGKQVTAQVTHLSQFSLLGDACYWADILCDGCVDVADIQEIANHWRSAEGDVDHEAWYDIDADGIVTVIDIMQVAAEWGWGCP